MIEKEKIEAIKRDTDLVALFEAKGIRMKKNGKSYFGLCPFHDDKTPSLSINPTTNLWQCFGCNKGGDAIRFIELFDQVDFKEAIKRLTPLNLQEEHTDNHHETTEQTQPAHQQYLERVISIYENNFTQKNTGKTYLNKRGITDAGLFNRYRLGLCDGSLKEILPNNGDTLDTLKEMGILLDNETERFKNCVVFPIYNTEGDIITLYGRSLTDEKKHRYLPQRPTGLWNSAIIKTCADIILTESIMDALSVMMAGYPNVVSIQNTNGLTDHDITDLKTYGIQKITLLLDGDAPGRKAAERLKQRLTDFTLDIKTLPDAHDPNSFLLKHGPQELAECIQSENPTKEDPQPPVTMEDGLMIPCGMRRYQIMGLDKGPNKLRAAIRLEHAGKLHIDNFDLYSARARTKFEADLCRKFEEIPETIEADITRIIKACEGIKEDPLKAEEEKQATPNMTDKEKAQAEGLGKSKNLIKQILKDFETTGLIGEENNKLLGYIAMTSRKRKEPISMQILSSSGAGKTALQDAVVNFCPPEDLVKLTSLSGKALFYKERMSLKHKVLALEEGDGAEDASYAIRSLISSGVLINETTIKDLATGRLTTMENRVEGPTSVFYTTTNPDVDPETKSRFFVTGIDESREQTRKILAFQREKHQQDEITQSMRSEAIITKHRNFQRLLKPLGVKNPFSSKLTYGDDRLQGRRDQPKYLNLIKAVAFLRQMQKPIQFSRNNGNAVPYIEVDREDIQIANHLAQEILGRSLDELSRPGRDLLMLLDEMIEDGYKRETTKDKAVKIRRTDLPFTRRDIREYTGWTNTRVHRYLKELVDLEYVLIDNGRNGSRYHYRLAYEGQGKDGERFILGLMPTKDLN